MSEPVRSEAAPGVSHIDHARSRRDKSDWRSWAKTLRKHYATLGKPAITIGALLADFADAEGHCYPKHDTLIEATGLASRTVSGALKQLHRVGAIRYQPGRGREWSHYWLVPHPSSASPAPQPRSTCGSESPPNAPLPSMGCGAAPSPAAPPLKSTSGSDSRGPNPSIHEESESGRLRYSEAEALTSSPVVARAPARSPGGEEQERNASIRECRDEGTYQLELPL